MITHQEKLMLELETLVDTHGLDEVLIKLGLVCFEKSEHIQCSYGDKPLAKVWEKRGNKLIKLSEIL